ncbi:apolipoprotein N-acyltransferase [Curtobacterium ammoniigenes]|uniref:apolipoprotein N-acyltransferase n=1 Tax=Curtobacterium ammoniigenes TaxID=395387 RepID=UPI0009F97BB1|nr:apolipoprotein N-acyltransferase [Curtobacterium ammoniigenes]
MTPLDVPVPDASTPFAPWSPDAVGTPTIQARAVPPFRVGVAVPLAVIGGGLFALSFPSPGWWWAVYPAVACMLLAVMGQPWRRASWLGYVAGAAFFIPAVSWAGRYLGPVPWLALALVEAAFVAVGLVAIALAYRWVPRAVPTRAGRVWFTPLIVAALWTGREWWSGSWPYGGFAWGRVGLSQTTGPFLHLVAYVGVLGLSFVVVYLVAVVVALMLEHGWARTIRVGVAGVLVSAVLAVPAWDATTSGTVRVEAVQGDGPAGYFSNAQPGQVLQSQMQATRTGVPGVGLVVWPEASAEFDPRRYPQVAAELNAVVAGTHAPLVAGAITETPAGALHNTSFVWTKSGWAGSYDKKRPVPFGEYVPDRWFYSKIAPSLIGLLQRDYLPGTKPNVLHAGGLRVGVAICFDIVDDALTEDMAHSGAQIILAQTNNADFDGTDENLQQLQIARMRAVELGRSLVNISTVGASQVIGPDGRTLASVPPYTATSMIADVPLGTSTPPDVVLAPLMTLVLALGGVLTLVAVAPWGSDDRRQRAWWRNRGRDVR